MTNNLSYAKLIEANAGSGKTFSLTLEYIKLLLQGETVDHILATTFTKKAASEILQRVIKRLSESVIDETAKKELLSQINLKEPKVTPEIALKNLIKFQHKIMISTMDSFFAKVATIFSTELGFSSNISISSDDLKESIISEAIRNVCNDEKSKDIYYLLKELNNNSEIKGVNDDLGKYFSIFYDEFKKSKRENWLQLKSECKVPTDKQINDLIKMITDAPCPKTAGGKESANFAKLKIKLVTSLLNKQDWNEILKISFFTNILSGNYTYCRVKTSQIFLDIAMKIFDFADACYIDQLNKKLISIYELIEKFAKSYEKIRDSLSTLDFSELKYKLEQISTLDNLSEIYFRLDSSFRHILLDEFQDTSLEEWKIIKPIIDEILSNEERTFFCVGDPKQAIYAWRGGVSDIFKKIPILWPQVITQELTKSYRSSQVIIDFVNLICKNFDSSFFDDEYQNLINNWNDNFPIHDANNKDLKGHILVEIVKKENSNEMMNDDDFDDDLSDNSENLDEDDDSDELLEDEEENKDPIIIKKTCERIIELLAKAPNISIGVLCRNNKFVGKVIKALNKEPYNIKASQEGKIDLVEFKSVVFVLSVLKYLIHRNDTMCLFKIKNALLDSEFDIDEILSIVDKLIISDGFKAATYYLYELIKPKISNQDIVAMKELIDICINFDQSSNKNIDDFIRHVSIQKMINISASNVKVMTIHAAKGLEFDAVILPNLEENIYKKPEFLIHYYKDRTQNPDKIYLKAPSNISKLLEFKHEEYQEMLLQERLLKLEESLCLLYVALTRAKQSLTIFIPENINNKVLEHKIFYSMASFVLEVLNIENKIRNNVYEFGTKDFYIDKLKTNQKLGKSTNLNNEKLLKPNFKKNLKEKNLTVKSPSNEEGSGECKISDIFNLKLAHTLQRGSLYHKFYEKVSWIEELSIEKDTYITNDLLSEFSLNEIEEIFSKFENSLKFPKIKQYLSKSYYLKLWNVDEVELLKEEPFVYKEHNTIYKGIIDRVVVGYKNNRVTNVKIIDFKTDVISKDELENRGLFYKPQIDIYRTSLIRRYGDNIEIDATLLFVLMGEDYNYGNN